jgi:predicted permease
MLICLLNYSLIISASAPTAFVVYLVSKQFSAEEETVRKTIALSSVVSTILLVIIAIIIG